MNHKKEFEFTIESGKTEKHYWQDIWRYRELFYILAWRDIAVRYKQTIIGVLWAILRPLLSMVIFVVIFGKINKFFKAVDIVQKHKTKILRKNKKVYESKLCLLLDK